MGLERRKWQIDQAWFEGRKDKVELFYLSSYSRKLNAEDRLSADFEARSRVSICTQAKLKAATTWFMPSNKIYRM